MFALEWRQLIFQHRLQATHILRAEVRTQATNQVHRLIEEQRARHGAGHAAIAMSATADHDASALAIERLVQIAGIFERIVRTFQRQQRSEEHTSELQSLMRISYAVF